MFVIVLKKYNIIVYKNNKIFFKQNFLEKKNKYYTLFYVFHLLIKYGYNIELNLNKYIKK